MAIILLAATMFPKPILIRVTSNALSPSLCFLSFLKTLGKSHQFHLLSWTETT